MTCRKKGLFSSIKLIVFLGTIMLISELVKLKNSKELISIERDCHDEELTGYLVNITEQVVVMNLVDNDGLYEGLTVFETEQINEVFWGNREHKAINHLANKQTFPDLLSFNVTSFQETILELSKSSKSISIHCHYSEEKFDICEITKYDDNWFKIKTFGIKKTLSRMDKLFCRECISRVVVNSPYQNSIVELSAKEY